MMTRYKFALFLLFASVTSSLVAAAKPAGDAVVIVVSPTGDDHGAGTSSNPFQSLERAQQAARQANSTHDVIVKLADGTYRLAQPLRFSAQDGGRNRHTVSWQAAEGAHPVLSGAIQVREWRLWDRAKDIYVADVPRGSEARQLWVNDRLASAASVEIQRSDYTFTREGMVLKPGASLPDLQHANHLELRATGFFTERISPVERTEQGRLIMRQPAWDNNLWGYDTVEKPFHPELSHLYLANALGLLRKRGNGISTLNRASST